MCKFIYLHTEVDDDVEGTRFQPRRRIMYYRGTLYKALDKEKAQSLPGIYCGVLLDAIPVSPTKLIQGTYRGVHWTS